MSKTSGPRRTWWSEGVRFECQGTGRCCLSRGTHGYVYLTLADRRRLAGHLGLPTREFTRRHCGRHDGHFFLLPAEGEPARPDQARACRYLDGRRCGVYDARPAQCRTWPFWPENMRARAWDREVAAFCPGVGRGRLHSAQEIGDLLAQDPLAGRPPAR
jgi:Fe-S-cluster containining protein